MLAGDGFGNFRFAVPISIAVAATVVAAIFFLIAKPRAALAMALVAIAAAATVSARTLLEPIPDPLSLRRFHYDERITIEGKLIREAEPYHGRTHLYVAVNRAADPNSAMQPAHGVIRITLLHPALYLIGQRVRVTARIRFPRNYGNPGEFDYEAYEARQGVTATMVVTHGHGASASSIEVIGYQPKFPASQIESIRLRIGAFIDANLAHPEREEMRALIIGDRGGISDRLRNSFALTGMAHLLVISGLHLSFVAAAAFAAARLVLALFPLLTIRGYSNKIAALFAAITVAAYASIAGHHVSTIRALVMVLAYLFAVIIDRAREVLASLALAALIICIAVPGSTADIGFQLSFASVFVIVLGMRRFSAWWKRRRERAMPGPEPRGMRVAGVLLGYIAVSFWAMLGTAPLTAYHFNQFAIVGVVANVVVVPIMGFAAMILGLIAAALHLVSMPFDWVLLNAAGRLLAVGTRLARMFAALPMAWTRTFTPTIVELMLAYAIVALWLWWPLEAVDLSSMEGRDARPTSKLRSLLEVPEVARASLPASSRLRFAILGVLMLAVAIDAAWWIRQRYFNPDLRVTFLSVGQGDSAVVRFPGSRVMLIDGGGQFGEFDPGERILAPYLWSQKIMHVDYLALSHPELDHFGGFEFIARNFHPAQFWTIAAPTPDVRYRDLLAALADAKTQVQIVDSSFAIPQPGGVTLKCLNPSPGEIASRNNGSMVLELSFGLTSFLFTGDIEEPGERSLIGRDPEDLRATILKVPHHGSATSSSDELVEHVHPSLAVISDGYHNRFGFPAREVVRRYQALGVRVLRTDTSGAIEVDAAGAGMVISTFSDRD